MSTLSAAARALLAGAVCLAIVGGMLVGHAWPLWTGEVVRMKVQPVDPRDLFRGEFVRLSMPANRMIVGDKPATPSEITGPIHVRGAGDWRGTDPGYRNLPRGSVMYVQLERSPAGDFQAVSVSREPVAGARNLRGRLSSSSSEVLTVDYGLDAFFMQEGTARPIEDAIRAGRKVEMDVAIASSGRARIRNLVVDGQVVGR